MPSQLRLPDCRLVMVAGRLGKAPELRHVASGDAACTLSLAVNLYKKDKDKDTLWLDCDCWGKTAEVAAQFPKGAPVLVEGSLDQQRWRDKTGEERTKLYVRVSRVQRLEWAEAQERSGGYEPKESDDGMPF